MDKPLVLIVDDAQTNILALTRTLGNDYEIKVANDGRLALELARLPDQPDLILLDVMMPEMDGYEVCRQLKTDPLTQSIPVIFITAMDQEADEAHGLSIGAIDYITKPFSPAIVQARVRNHIALKRNTDLLEMLVAVDGLTGLANRRRFDEALKAEWVRGYRASAPLAVIFADIDRFKAYNDYYGHSAGDECLIQVATAFTASITRASDTTARYGGEEFIAVLPETDASGAGEVAERCRAAVEALALPHAPATLTPCVTISVGYAWLIPSAEHRPADLVEAADRALYEAKRAGRNRVRLAASFGKS